MPPRRPLALSLLAAALTLPGLHTASADDTLVIEPASGMAEVRDDGDSSGWKRTTIYQDPARALFDTLPAASEELLTRDDGSTFVMRQSSALACTASSRYALWRCGFYLHVDGRMAPAVIDPDMGSVARIGVGN